MRKIKLFLLVLLIATPIFFLAVDQSYALFGRWQTKIGNPPPPGAEKPPDSGGGGFDPSLPPVGQLDCSSGSSGIETVLRKKLNTRVVAGGMAWAVPPSGIPASAFKPQAPTCQIKKNIYKILRSMSVYPSFMNKLIKPSRILTFRCYTISSSYNYGGSLGVATLDGNNIQYLRCNLINPNGTYFLLLHEMGHIIHRRNNILLTGFTSANLHNKDNSCYDGYFLKSYWKRTASSPVNEAFGDAISLFYYNRSFSTYLSSQIITGFKTKCPKTYNWMKNNIYGKDRLPL